MTSVNSSEKLTRVEGLVEKTSTAISGLSKSLETDLNYIDDSPVERDDARRLLAVSQGLFDAADTLIALAEQARAVQLRRERSAGIQASGEEISKIETIQFGEYELTVTPDEKSFLEILFEQEQMLRLADFIELGFGIAASSDISKRKSLFKKTLASLAPKLAQVNAQIVTTGQTRSTRYGLAPIDESEDSLNRAERTYEDVVAEPQPVRAPDIPELRADAPRDQLELKVKAGIDRLIDETTKPIVRVGMVIRYCMGNSRLEPQEYQRAVEAIGKDERITFAGKGEYRIIGRSLENWIDTDMLSSIADEIVSLMETRDQIESNEYSRLAQIAASHAGQWLVSDEHDTLRTLVTDHPRVAMLSYDKIRLRKVEKPYAGLSPTELDAQLGKMGLKNQSAFRSRRE